MKKILITLASLFLIISIQAQEGFGSGSSVDTSLFVKRSQTINGTALSGNITLTKSSFVGTDSATNLSQGFMTGADHTKLMTVYDYYTINALGSVGVNQTITNASYRLTTMTITASISITLSDLTAIISRVVFVKITQGGAGTYTVTWAGNILFPGGIQPVMSTGVGAIDFYTFVWDGTKYILTGVSYAVQ